MAERDPWLTEKKAEAPQPPPGSYLHFNDQGEWVKSTLGRTVGPGLIYFIQSHTHGPVKIGFTGHSDVTGRLKALQTSHPYPLTSLLEVPGTMQEERAIHKALAPERLLGEWFEWAGRTVQLLELLIIGRRPLADALAAIEAMDKPNCPAEWDSYYTAESNVWLLFQTPQSNTLSKARIAGTGPAFRTAAAGGRTGRYYRLSDIKRWLVAQQIPHGINHHFWHRCVFDAALLEDAPE